jgi:hypothetical protein
MLYDSTLLRRTIAPAVRTNGTHNGAAVNFGTGGFDSAIVAIVTGTITDGSHAVAIEDSDDGATGWGAVPAGRLVGSPPTVVAANDDTVFEIGVTPAKQYLRVSVTTTGATTGGLLAAVVVAGEPGSIPISHA